MAIRFKESVRLTKVDPRLWKGILEFHRVRQGLTPLELTITSLEDGVHRGTSGYDSQASPPSNSRHYLGLAVDIRSKDLDTQDKDTLLLDATLALSGLGEPLGYYLILEAKGTDNEHFHLQAGKW